MREVFLSDITSVVRVLLLVPVSERCDLCEQMFTEADWADKFTRRHQKPHSLWGNGTLMAAARTRELAAERSFADGEYLLCFMAVLQCLEHHRVAKTCKSNLHSHMKYELHHGFAFG